MAAATNQGKSAETTMGYTVTHPHRTILSSVGLGVRIPSGG
jgi:hypothetical protein